MTTVSNLELSSFQHTPFYCEENVYQLCKKLCAGGLANPDASDLFAVFICNDKKQVALWNQKASHRADGVVLWDYHVICIQKRKDENSSHLVWDLDSTLPFPSPLPSYVFETTRPSFPLFSEFKRYFRIVHAPIFLRYFASDRSHMIDNAGNWQSPPPTYEAIVAEDGTLNNLNEYIDVSSKDATKDLSADAAVNAVFEQRFGIVVVGSQLEEFLSLVSDP